MSIAKANISDISTFKTTISRQNDYILSISQHFLNDVENKLSLIAEEIRNIRLLCENIYNNIAKLKNKLETLKEEQHNISNLIASTPKTIKVTRTDSNGNSYVVEVTNPKYLELLSKLNNVKSQINDVKQSIDSHAELLKKCQEQISRLESVSHVIYESQSRYNDYLNRLQEINEEALSRLKNIEYILNQYKDIKIEPPNLSSYGISSSGKGFFDFLNGIGSLISVSSFRIKSKVHKKEYDNFYDMYDFIDSLNASSEYKESLAGSFSLANETLKVIFNRYAKKFDCKSCQSSSNYYSPDENAIYINAVEDMNHPCGIGTSFYHECGHMLDDIAGNESKIGCAYSAFYGLFKEILTDYRMTIDQICRQNNCNVASAKEILSNIIISNPYDSYIVSDIFNGLSNNDVDGYYEHDEDYYKKNHFNVLLSSEAFASITSQIMISNQKSLNFTYQYMPNTINKYYQIVDEFLK